MSVIIEVELKEVLGQISQQIQKLDEKIQKLDEKVDRLVVDTEVVKTKLDGLDKRVENQEFTSRGVLIGFTVAILGGLAKMFGFFGAN